jgi:uncharacterized membrane protein
MKPGPNTEREKRHETVKEKMDAKSRRVRHDVADSLLLMGFSLGASITVATMFAITARVTW